MAGERSVQCCRIGRWLALAMGRKTLRVRSASVYWKGPYMSGSPDKKPSLPVLAENACFGTGFWDLDIRRTSGGVYIDHGPGVVCLHRHCLVAYTNVVYRYLKSQMN